MKVAGIILVIFGVLILAVGTIAFFVNLTSTYAQSVCYKAADDKEKFLRARMICKDTASDCYKRTTAGYTSDSDCDYAKSGWIKAVIVSGVIAAFGFFLAIIGLLMLFIKRRKTIAAPALA